MEKPYYYPRKMRTGWCVCLVRSIMGIDVERYGTRCAQYADALQRCDELNRELNKTTPKP